MSRPAAIVAACSRHGIAKPANEMPNDDLRHVQLPHLETFARAAELRSFTAAARALGLTQAAVSQRIAVLEQSLDVALFHRRGGRVLLTGPAGTMIFADTSGFHRGGWTRAKPRILSYSSYVSTKFRLEPRFEVDWSAGNGLSPEAEFAVSWSR